MTSRWTGKYSGSAVNAFYDWAVTNDGVDQNDGAIYHDGVVNYYRFTLPDGENPAVIDEWHDELDAAEDVMHAEDIIALCTDTIGVIVKATDDGFVSADTFTSVEMFQNTWKNLLDEHTLNQCDQCDAEAKIYGINEPITHAPGCSERDDSAVTGMPY